MFESRRIRFTLQFVLMTSAALTAHTAKSSISPEKQSKTISLGLKGYSDSEWSSIAGPKSEESYDILSGDNLYSISGRLFGDTKYWPKIWEINNQNILNPHMIYPGQALVFSPGSGSTLPTIELKNGQNPGPGSPVQLQGNSALSNSSSGSMIAQAPYDPAADLPGPPYDEKTPKPSDEWKKLTQTQRWENIQVIKPPEVDKDGFDSRSRVFLRKTTTGFELDYLVTCAPIQAIGEILGSRESSNYAMLTEEVTLESFGEPGLEENRTYAIVSREPIRIRSNERDAYSYTIKGKVKIIGVNDGVWLGTIADLKGLAERGDLIIPVPDRAEIKDPVPGKNAHAATMILEKNSATFVTGQHRWVYIDRGSRDEIEPGMIYRVFQYRDPRTNKFLTESNMLVQGDIQVVQTCEDFSMGTILWSKETLTDQTPLVLMTDVEDYYSRYYMNGVKARGYDGPGGKTGAPGEEDDWLDKLDNNQELGSEEERELKQLEEYQDQPKPDQPTEEIIPDGLPEEGEPVAPESETSEIAPEAPTEELPPVEDMPADDLNNLPPPVGEDAADPQVVPQANPNSFPAEEPGDLPPPPPPATDTSLPDLPPDEELMNPGADAPVDYDATPTPKPKPRAKKSN